MRSVRALTEGAPVMRVVLPRGMTAYPSVVSSSVSLAERFFAISIRNVLLFGVDVTQPSCGG